MNGIPVWIEDKRDRSLKIGDLSSEIWDLWGFWRFDWSFEARKGRRGRDDGRKGEENTDRFGDGGAFLVESLCRELPPGM